VLSLVLSEIAQPSTGSLWWQWLRRRVPAWPSRRQTWRSRTLRVTLKRIDVGEDGDPVGNDADRCQPSARVSTTVLAASVVRHIPATWLEPARASGACAACVGWGVGRGLVKAGWIWAAL
jgi:hypothetical protein